jgi:hypothetical protein
VAVPVFASEYPTFDVTSGSITMTVIPAGVAVPPSVTTPVTGTFALSLIEDHIGDSDMVSVDDVDIVSTSPLHTVLISVATADIMAGSVRFTDFTISPGHLSGGVANPVGSGYMEVTVFVTGAFYTTFATGAWGASGLTTVTLASSQIVELSNTITAGLTFGYIWEIGVSSMSTTLTMDFVVALEGTAHVPEPALGSLVALGLGGAGAWLRRRRS